MDSARKLHVVYGLVVVMLLVVAGALYVGYEQRGAEVERVATAQRSLLAENEALKAEAKAQREKLAALEADLKAAQDRSAQLATVEADLKSAQERNAQLAAQAASLAKGLSETERKAKAAAEARAELSRELQAKDQTLGEAMARSAELNKAYESLLKDKDKLAADSAGYRAELERTRQSFEEVQGVIARLTGARGIYTVQEGDSLSKIAAFFYHNAWRWPDIQKANAHLIAHPDLIYPLQVLIVPK